MTNHIESFKPVNNGEISLTNRGHLELFFVGVGAAFASRAYQSNMLVVKGGHHLMIDLGSKAQVALQGAGITVSDIQNLLVTHSHADHIGGMEEWCLRARYSVSAANGGAPGDYKPSLLTTSDYAHVLWDASLRGGLAHSENRLGRLLGLSDYVALSCGEYVTGYDRPVYCLSVGQGDTAISLKLMRTNHLPDSSKGWWTAFYSVGAVIDDRIFISGDTMFDRELVEVFGSDAEIIFHDCQDFKGGVHAAYEELKQLPPEIKQKMILYHLPDGIEQRYRPEADGFGGWARPYTEGSYQFSASAR
ncbi:MAG: MBL fold metallo-hydrolase [Myxococcota bacterium]|nr:MBL fold metallo-hydrolase [Myxococcota bacterium]